MKKKLFKERYYGEKIMPTLAFDKETGKLKAKKKSKKGDK